MLSKAILQETVKTVKDFLANKYSTELFEFDWAEWMKNILNSQSRE